jgi:hypothetical protein
MRNPITLAVLLALAGMPLGAGAADATSDERPRAIIDDPSERNALGYGTEGIPAEAPPEGYGLGVTSNLGGPRAPGEVAPGPEVSDERPRAIVDDPSERNTLGYGTSGIPAEAPPEGYGPGVTSNLGGPRAPSEAEPGPDVSDERPRAIVDDPSERSTLGYGTSGIAEEVPPGNIGLESNLGAPDTESAPAQDPEEPGTRSDAQPDEGPESR